MVLLILFFYKRGETTFFLFMRVIFEILALPSKGNILQNHYYHGFVLILQWIMPNVVFMSIRTTCFQHANIFDISYFPLYIEKYENLKNLSLSQRTHRVCICFAFVCTYAIHIWRASSKNHYRDNDKPKFKNIDFTLHWRVGARKMPCKTRNISYSSLL